MECIIYYIKLILIQLIASKINYPENITINLSAFYSLNNISHDLLRFKNTSKLSITMDAKYDIFQQNMI